MGSTMALLRPCLCETTSAVSVDFLRFFAWFDHWCIWDKDACRSASPFPFLWADLSDNTLLMVFNSAEPTVALPCMAGLVSLSFGRLKFRAWWTVAWVSWRWGFSTPQPVSLEHKPSMTFCSHFSGYILGANRVTCFLVFDICMPQVNRHNRWRCASTTLWDCV